MTITRGLIRCIQDDAQHGMDVYSLSTKYKLPWSYSWELAFSGRSVPDLLAAFAPARAATVQRYQGSKKGYRHV